MNDYELTWYLQEISMHGLAAERDFAEALALIADPQTKQKRFVWSALTSFLANAAMISKYLDPVGPLDKTKRNRKDVLRAVLNINERSAVLPRTARDNVEHFDERIDNWVGQDPNSIIELVFDTRKDFEHLCYGKTRIRRAFIVEGGVFLSEDRNGNIFELVVAPVFGEIKKITDQAQEWLEHKSPYVFIQPN